MKRHSHGALCLKRIEEIAKGTAAFRAVRLNFVSALDMLPVYNDPELTSLQKNSLKT